MITFERQAKKPILLNSKSSKAKYYKFKAPFTMTIQAKRMLEPGFSINYGLTTIKITCN